MSSLVAVRSAARPAARSVGGRRSLGLSCPAARRHFAVLSHSWAGGAEAEAGSGRVAVLLHGILGSKSNWNTPARRLHQQIRSEGWRVLQIDHRAHGQSEAGEAPHTLQACAAEVLETLDAAGVRVDQDELVMCGHSFGGKVALAFLQERLHSGGTLPRKTWLFDSVPGQPVEHSPERQRAEQSVSYVLGAVERAAAKGTYADRAALVESLQKEQHLVKPLAQWVAQSVRAAEGGGVRLSYDVGVIRALYDSYRSTCMWHVVEDGRAEVGVVVAGRNKHAWGDENLRRLEACGDHVDVVTLDAGHNVHVDDLPGLLAALSPTFA